MRSNVGVFLATLLHLLCLQYIGPSAAEGTARQLLSPRHQRSGGLQRQERHLGVRTPHAHAARTRCDPPLDAIRRSLRAAGLEDLCTEGHRERRFQASWAEDGAEQPALLQEEEECGGLVGTMKCERHAEDDVVEKFLQSLRSRNQQDYFRAVPCDLYKRIHGRTLWLLGDSQTFYWYKSLRCFMHKFVVRQSPDALDADIPEAEEDRQWLKKEYLQHESVSWFSQADILPTCTNLVGETRICFLRTNLARQVFDLFLPKYRQISRMLDMKPTDLMVMNFGLWHQHPKPSEWNHHDWYNAYYEDQLHTLTASLKKHEPSLPVIMWRDTPAQHFDIEHGEFPRPEKAKEVLPQPYTCPALDVSIDSSGHLHGADTHVVHGGWRNQIAKPIMEAAGIPYINTWNETSVLEYMHVTSPLHFSFYNKPWYDCSHFCSPGPYSTFTSQLLKMMPEVPLRPMPTACRH